MLFSNPEAVRQIFQLPPESYECRPFNEYYESVMGGHSLFLTDGAEHRRMRRVLMPPLHRQLVETARRGHSRSSSREAIATWPTGEAFSPRPAMHLLSLRIMLGVIFGSGDDDLAHARSPACFREEIYQDLGSWSVWTRFSHLHPRFRELIAARSSGGRRSAARTRLGRPCSTRWSEARDEAGNLLSEEEIQDHHLHVVRGGRRPDGAGPFLGAVLGSTKSRRFSRELRSELAELGPEPDSPSRAPSCPTWPRSARRRCACTRSRARRRGGSSSPRPRSAAGVTSRA